MGIIYRAQILGTLFGQQVANVIAVGAEPIDATDIDATNQQRAQDVAQDVATSWAGNIMPSRVPEYVLQGVVTYDVFQPEFAGEATLNVPGGTASPALPGFVAAKVNITTGLRGRAYRGRTGIAGLYELEVTGNALTTQSVGALQVRVDDFVGDLLTASGANYESIRVGVLSTVSGGEPRLSPLWTPATAVTVQAGLGTRVSRLR